MITAVNECRVEGVLPGQGQQVGRLVAAGSQRVALTGDKEPTVRPVRAERMAITARSSIREYARDDEPSNESGEGWTCLGRRGVLIMWEIFVKMQEKFLVYRLCFQEIIFLALWAAIVRRA